jgi:hypothetical protein
VCLAGCVCQGLVGSRRLYTGQWRDQIGVSACIDCVLERSNTARTVSLKLDKTPNTANSKLSTDNSATNIGGYLGNAQGYRIYLF